MELLQKLAKDNRDFNFIMSWEMMEISIGILSRQAWGKKKRNLEKSRCKKGRGKKKLRKV